MATSGPAGSAGFWQNLKNYSDTLVAALVVVVVFIIVIPVPPLLLDVLLSFSLTMSLVILISTTFVTRPLQLSVFPTLLLVITLFRLSLNISSTRLILGSGAAGQVIQSFGSFVIGGNYVVGLIVFLIITIIQFVVITNGAGRTAEVAARFTLDAMPGKQMAIDADLNAGLISEDEARQRRAQLQREADFYGAMDGASKFVRGDAIAGLIITAINIAGGLLIGILQRGLELDRALQTYTILTVGDGLVSQVPALLVSTATGILLTRTGAEGNFGRELFQQLTSFPQVIILASVVLAALGIMPGMPNLPFLSLAAGTGYVGYTLSRETKRREEARAREKEQAAFAAPRQPENVLSLLQVDPLEVEIGYNLVSLADESRGGNLLDRLAATRRQFAMDMGMFVRPIRIRDNLSLRPNAYSFKLRGIPGAQGEIYPGRYLAILPPGGKATLEGLSTKEPTFGLPAVWIEASQRQKAEVQGATVVDAGTVLVTHLAEFIKAHAHELLGRQEVKEMLDAVREQNPAVVEELVPAVLTLGEVQRVLQNLLREKVPIRDLVTILETLSDQGRLQKDPDLLTEAVRKSLYRTISRQYADLQGKLPVLILHPNLERLLADSLQTTSTGVIPVLEPVQSQKVVGRIAGQAEKMAARQQTPVILCSSRIRLPLVNLLQRSLPNVAVVAMAELAPELQVESVGTVTLD